MEELDRELYRPPKEGGCELLGIDLKTHEYLLDILASIIRDVFSENGQRGYSRGCALRVATLNHDASYGTILRLGKF